MKTVSVAFLLTLTCLASVRGENVVGTIYNVAQFQQDPQPFDWLFVRYVMQNPKYAIVATGATKIQGHPNSRIQVFSLVGSDDVPVAWVVGRQGTSLYHVTGEFRVRDPFEKPPAPPAPGNAAPKPRTWWADYNKGDGARLMLEVNGSGTADDVIVKAVNSGSVTVRLANATKGQKYSIRITQAAQPSGIIKFPGDQLEKTIELTGPSAEETIVVSGDTEGALKLTATCNPLSVDITANVTGIAIASIAAKPNNALAINDAFVKQEGDVGVLVGWVVQFTGSGGQSGDTYTWESRTHGGADPWASLANGKVATWTAAKGDFDVRMKVVSGGATTYTAERRLLVGEVQYTDGSFVINQSSAYSTYQGFPHCLKGPTVPLTATGKIVFVGNPKPANIMQAFIQGTKRAATSVAPEDVTTRNVQWAPGQPQGAQETFYGKADFSRNTGGKWVNDAPPGCNIFPSSEPQPIDGTASAGMNDAPIVLGRGAWRWFRPKALIQTQYVNTQKTTYDADFHLWLVVVVVNSDMSKTQYVPVKMRDWEVKIDTTDVKEWRAKPVGAVQNPVKPTDASTTSTVESPIVWTDIVTITK